MAARLRPFIMTMVNPRQAPGQRFRFSDCELDPDNHVLLKGGAPVKLAPLPFKVLALLVNGRGQLITREGLCRAVWPDDVTVDFEHGLNTCIRQIRAVLGDDAETGRIIETVPRVGYRLKVPVTDIRSLAKFQRHIAVIATGLSLMVTMLVVAWASRQLGQRSETQRVVAELNEQARLALTERTTVRTVAARQLFERSRALDPGSARAQAGIANTYMTSPSSLADVNPHEAYAKATTAAAHALAIDASEPAAHLAAAVARRMAYDWSGAVREHRRAVELGPNDSSMRVAYSFTAALMGDFDTALSEARRAVELDASSPLNQRAVAVALRFARRYEDCIVAAHKALDLDPTYGAVYHVLGLCTEATGRVDEAIGYYERSGQPTGNLGHAYAVAGRTDAARALIARFEVRYKEKSTGAGEIAQVYAGLGELGRAFDWLERAVELGDGQTLKVADVWDPLRADPRFEPLLRRSGLR